MDYIDKDILFTNFTYNPEVYYFLYIGDLKAYGLNHFLQETLSRRLNGRPVRFIAVVPDICIQYNYTNLIVINPSVEKDIVDEEAGKVSLHGCKTSCRIRYDRFISAVSSNPTIRKLIATIRARQNHLYISLFENIEELTLDEIDGVSVIGPDKKIARRYNNKILQYRELEGMLPMPEYRVCQGLDSLLETTAQLREGWREGIFISLPYSSAGSNSAVTYTQDEVHRQFQDTDGMYLITRYVPHDFDPTVLAVVGNSEDVYIAGVADQVIVGGNRFTGSKYPSVLDPAIQKQLHDYTVQIGRFLGGRGYRGIFGCDFIVTKEQELLFLEINARKQGTTLEFCYTLEQSLPEGSPSLMELEYLAVTEDRFPRNTIELESNVRGLHWGTYNFKLDTRKRTTGYIPQNTYERDAFRKVASGELIKDFAILEHIGTNFFVLPGTFLARVVSVAKNRQDVDEGLCQGVGFIQQTIEEA